MSYLPGFEFEALTEDGDRICPGRHLADTSTWSVMANLVAAFDISKALDEKGNEMTLKVEFCTGFVRCVI